MISYIYQNIVPYVIYEGLTDKKLGNKYFDEYFDIIILFIIVVVQLLRGY